MDLVTLTDCRSLYREVLQGHTYIEEENIYVKHFKESDLGFIEYCHKRCQKELIEKGVLPLADKLLFLRENDYWTEEEEEGYEFATAAVKDAYEFRNRLQNPEQREAFEETIKKQEKKLSKIQDERYKLLEPTIESFCSKKINEEYVKRALYKDKDLKEEASQEFIDTIKKILEDA